MTASVIIDCRIKLIPTILASSVNNKSFTISKGINKYIPLKVTAIIYANIASTNFFLLFIPVD